MAAIKARGRYLAQLTMARTAARTATLLSVLLFVPLLGIGAADWTEASAPPDVTPGHLARDPFQPLLNLSPPRMTPVLRSFSSGTMPARAMTVTVPIVNLGRLFIVEAQINGSQKVRLVVDTGASYTVLFPEVVKSLGLGSDSGDPDLSLWTAGGEVDAQILTLHRLQVGDASVFNLPVVVLGVPNPPEGIHGLLGLSFLNQFVMTLDPRSAQLHLKTTR